MAIQYTNDDPCATMGVCATEISIASINADTDDRMQSILRMIGNIEVSVFGGSPESDCPTCKPLRTLEQFSRDMNGYSVEIHARLENIYKRIGSI